MKRLIRWLEKRHATKVRKYNAARRAAVTTRYTGSSKAPATFHPDEENQP